MSAIEQITVLGATGSVGLNTLDVIARHPDKYGVFALTANSKVDELAELCVVYKPKYAVLGSANAAQQLKDKLNSLNVDTEVLCGDDGLCQVASHPQVDSVMAAIVGAAGLNSTLAAAKAGKKVLLANKEALVMAGDLFMQAIAASGATLLPIDSEHNAIFQCLPQTETKSLAEKGVERILLTASGGPFRQFTAEQMRGVSPEQACAHPNWSMGRKISVDSATLMNKGLELIEACWLFDTDQSGIDVVVHPQSIIHSMVRYVDGSVIAQMGNPDMRTPIAYGLAWPERIDAGVKPLDFIQIGSLDFEAPDEQRFPCLVLAREAWQQGGTASAVLNAANEIAVAAFLNKIIGFTDIASIIEQVLAKQSTVKATTIEVVQAADAEARLIANQIVAEIH
ncbi:MAG: 1-deoxy-D-xylulose-5-phosphate reductoisomerase [Pseudomonadales bacterium]|jgi:1-deoxy-D-xylulose-5-phosphate reductoisomerase